MPDNPKVIYQYDLPIMIDTDTMIGGILEIGHAIACDGLAGVSEAAIYLIKDKWNELPAIERDRVTSAIFNTFDIGLSLQILDIKRVGKYTFRITGEVR